MTTSTLTRSTAKVSQRFVDVPYPQKHAAKVIPPGGRHAIDVRCVAMAPDGWLYAGTGLYLFRVRQSFRPDRPLAELMPEWQPEATVETVTAGGSPLMDIRDVRADAQGVLWACGGFGIASCPAAPEQGAPGAQAPYEPRAATGAQGAEAQEEAHEVNGSQSSWRIVTQTPAPQGVHLSVTLSILPAGDTVWIATSHSGVGKLVEGRFVSYPEPDHLPGLTWRLDPGPDGAFWACGSDGVSLLTPDGALLHRGLKGLQVRKVLRHGDLTLAATSDGLYVLDESGSWRKDPGRTPVRDLRDLLIARDGSLWAATSHGVWRRKSDGSLAYYASQRWLPGDDARALAESPEGTVWVATRGGLAHLAELPSTLHEKAQRFEARIRARHVRLKGYVTTSRLERPGDLTTNRTRPSDNDGLWTSMYLAAQSYQYAATGDPAARERAVKAFEAVAWLEEVTTIPGFPTKAVIPRDEAPEDTRVPWYPSADGQWLWKGDCSSDEIVGHMYGYSIFYDLVAGEAEKPKVRAVVSRIMDHILDHGYYLIGPDGRPTQWGFWGPDRLNQNPKDRAERGLNSLEILSHLRAAYHITQDRRYLEAYHNLIDEHRYTDNLLRQKIDAPGHVNHSDDELAFLSYYPLLKYETDPKLRAVYLESLERAWQIERPERNPLWNLIYGALTGRPCDIAETVETLREIPLDLITWHVQNSHRLDVDLDYLAGRFGEIQSVRVLPYDELPTLKWNANPYRLDGGDGGFSEEDGTHFLLPYWMARYYGFIVEEGGV